MVVFEQKMIISKGCIRNPEVKFTFNVKDKPIYIYLKEEVLKGGSIFKVKGKNVCRYTIVDKKNLIKIINLINGKFCTPKICNKYRKIIYG